MANKADMLWEDVLELEEAGERHEEKHNARVSCH